MNDFLSDYNEEEAKEIIEETPMVSVPAKERKSIQRTCYRKIPIHPYRKYSLAAAIVLFIVLSFSVYHKELVVSALQQFIPFLPGYGVIDEKEDSDYFLVDAPETMNHTSDKYNITVKEAYVKDRKVTVVFQAIATRGEGKQVKDSKLLLEADGQNAPLQSITKKRISYGYQLKATFQLKNKKVTNNIRYRFRYNINKSEVNFFEFYMISKKEVKKKSSLASIGQTITNNGISYTMQSVYEKKKQMLTVYLYDTTPKAIQGDTNYYCPLPTCLQRNHLYLEIGNEKIYAESMYSAPSLTDDKGKESGIWHYMDTYHYSFSISPSALKNASLHIGRSAYTYKKQNRPLITLAMPKLGQTISLDQDYKLKYASIHLSGIHYYKHKTKYHETEYVVELLVSKKNKRANKKLCGYPFEVNCERKRNYDTNYSSELIHGKNMDRFRFTFNSKKNLNTILSKNQIQFSINNGETYFYYEPYDFSIKKSSIKYINN
ncbi:hypothetical protein lbkm_2737 [Lachnospiraceae bacterium KM106-2]|nr:hypothetical protein lbkm_2737 [Lachnospiraceae bacterium KM106-2]